MTDPTPPAPARQPTVAEAWPLPVLPLPCTLSLSTVQVPTKDGPAPRILVQLLTPAGAAFGFLEPDKAERVFDDGTRLAKSAQSGILRPLNGRLIVPGQPG